MPYPDKLLAEDEEVVRHLHPHWLALVRPVLVLLLVAGGTSYAAALVPAGSAQGTARAVVAGLALVVLVVAVGLVPLISTETARPTGWGYGHDRRGDDKLLFFAADGLVQNRIEEYADRGGVPGFRELLRKGARASSSCSSR